MTYFVSITQYEDKYSMELELDLVEDTNCFRPNLVQDPDNLRWIAADIQNLLITRQMLDDDLGFRSNIAALWNT